MAPAVSATWRGRGLRSGKVRPAGQAIESLTLGQVFFHRQKLIARYNSLTRSLRTTNPTPHRGDPHGSPIHQTVCNRPPHRRGDAGPLAARAEQQASAGSGRGPGRTGDAASALDAGDGAGKRV